MLETCWPVSFIICVSLDTVDSITIRLLAGRSGFRFPIGIEIFNVPTCSCAYLVSYPMVTGVKQSRRDADHSPPIYRRGKGCVELYLSSPLCLYGLDMEKNYE